MFLTRQFEHDFLDLPAVSSIDTPNGRFYTTPDGNRYRSVTTFLGEHTDNTWLEEWKDRVGEEEVSKRSTQAKRRGTAVHNIIEQYLLNNKAFSRGQMPVNLVMFESMRKKLDAHIGKIKGIELGLWSDRLMLAGRCDLLAEWDSKLSIVDFKTSKWPKKVEDIGSYFLQTTIYAMMVEELTGNKVEQIVIIIGVDDEESQVFTESSCLHRARVLELASL